MTDGYRIWNPVDCKVLNCKVQGTYIARVLDRQAVELAKKEFVME